MINKLQQKESIKLLPQMRRKLFNHISQSCCSNHLDVHMNGVHLFLDLLFPLKMQWSIGADAKLTSPKLVQCTTHVSSHSLHVYTQP